MSKSGKPELSAGLIATKGSAAPASDMPSRAAMIRQPLSEPAQGKNDEPMNFKVPPAFKREFKAYAASHGLYMHELLKRSYEAYRKQQGD